MTRAIQKRQRDTNTKTMTITNTKTKTKTDTKTKTYMMVMMKIHIQKMATHVIPGPETGDTKEIGFAFLGGKE